MVGAREEEQQRRHLRFKKPDADQAPSGSKVVAAVAVLGIVYGDLGTSPIYSFRQAFTGITPVHVIVPNVLGAWAAEIFRAAKAPVRSIFPSTFGP